MTDLKNWFVAGNEDNAFAMKRDIPYGKIIELWEMINKEFKKSNYAGLYTIYADLEPFGLWIRISDGNKLISRVTFKADYHDPDVVEFAYPLFWDEEDEDYDAEIDALERVIVKTIIDTILPNFAMDKKMDKT